jgi:hypothetical protein
MRLSREVRLRAVPLLSFLERETRTARDKGRSSNRIVLSSPQKNLDGRMASTKAVLLTFLMIVAQALAQAQTETCVTITTSTECTAFTPFSVSTDSYLTGI